MTFAERNAAARAKAGVRSISHAQQEALKNSTPTSRTAARCDVLSNPPDGYAIAMKAAGTPLTPTPAAPKPKGPKLPEGFDSAQTLRNAKNPVFTSPPDGYQIAMKERLEKE